MLQPVGLGMVENQVEKHAYINSLHAYGHVLHTTRQAMSPDHTCRCLQYSPQVPQYKHAVPSRTSCSCSRQVVMHPCTGCSACIHGFSQQCTCQRLATSAQVQMLGKVYRVHNFGGSAVPKSCCKGGKQAPLTPTPSKIRFLMQ